MKTRYAGNVLLHEPGASGDSSLQVSVWESIRSPEVMRELRTQREQHSLEQLVSSVLTEGLSAHLWFCCRPQTAIRQHQNTQAQTKSQRKSLCSWRRLCCLLFLILCAVGNYGLAGEGFKPYFGDPGLYSGTPVETQPMNILLWSGRSLDFDGESTNYFDAPEGFKVADAFVLSSWGGWGIFYVTNFGSFTLMSRDCSEFAGGYLMFWLNSNTPLKLEMQYRTESGATGKVARYLDSTADQWIEQVIPLADFGGDLNLAQLMGPFLITAEGSQGNQAWAADDVRLVKPVVRLRVSPSRVRIEPGAQRQINIEGLTAEDDIVPINPSFEISSDIGTLTRASGPASQSLVFTAATNSGTVRFTLPAIPASLPGELEVEIVSSPVVPVSFGIYDESSTHLEMGVEGDILTYNGGDALPITLMNNTSNPGEGTASLDLTVNHPNPRAYSGIAVQWGTNGSGQSLTRDMSKYYAGDLNLMLKAPPVLQGKVQVGIRSGNVGAGTELSLVWLTDSGLFDNRWHQIRLPIRDFAKSAPWANLSRMKIFFNLAVIGSTGGATTLSIDAVRWETQIPEYRTAPSLLGITPGGGGLRRTYRVTLATEEGQDYRISRSWDLTTWLPICTLSGNGNPAECIDLVPSDRRFGFYRAESIAR